MISLATPLRFNPFLRSMPWGGRRLETLGKHLPDDRPYGESWEVSDHAHFQSVVAEGPWAGQSLRALMREHRDHLLGSAASAHGTFPWLIKFLDASDWLSVQVHPDENAVKRLWPGEGPKNEAWFVIAAEPTSRIFAGLLPGIGQQELRAALEQGTVADCLYQFTPRPGDFIYLPAGTVHAVGGGVLIAEVQQTSDATFRLFDWNRRNAQGKPRQLHIEEALQCIDWQRGPVLPLHVGDFGGRQGDTELSLVQTTYFQLNYVQHAAAFNLGGAGHLHALCIFSGEARVATGEVMRAGEVWIIPAKMPRTLCQAETQLSGLHCALPTS